MRGVGHSMQDPDISHRHRDHTDLVCVWEWRTCSSRTLLTAHSSLPKPVTAPKEAAAIASQGEVCKIMDVAFVAAKIHWRMLPWGLYYL